MAEVLHELGRSRIGMCLWIGWGLTPVFQFVDKYVFNDWQFLVTLLVVLAVDSVLGGWHAWRDGKWSSKGMGRVLQKALFYCLLLIAVHALATHKVRGEINDLLGWLDGLTYSAILVREFLSILEHSAALGIWQAPKWLLKRLAMFDAEGNPHPSPLPGGAEKDPHPNPLPVGEGVNPTTPTPSFDKLRTGAWEGGAKDTSRYLPLLSKEGGEPASAEGTAASGAVPPKAQSPLPTGEGWGEGNGGAHA